MNASPPTVKTVHSFWNTEACDTHVVKRACGDADFYERFREQRYRTQWHIPLLVPFADAKGKQVLEIGTGNGADGVMFAINGGIYTGVDLTEAALEATRKHFQVLGLSGTFQKENAEQLSFASESFDIVYSHGVLHHTPDTQATIDEVFRVLKPQGRAIIMLYHKHSFNYYIRILAYMRLRVFLKICSRLGSWKRDREQARSDLMIGLRGNQDRKVWEFHYRNFLMDGWGYLRARHFVHHCTDGPECPIAFTFSQREARRLFAKFPALEMKVAHLPMMKDLGWFPPAIEKWLRSRLGEYFLIFSGNRPC